MALDFIDMDAPLKGLKVLDLSSILAGPLTGSFLAELGAQVIKIENKLTDGDATRQWKLTSENKDRSFSAYYCSANYGKNVQMLDLTDIDERKQLDGIILDADIVISNFQKKTAEKLQLDPVTLVSDFPHLIVTQLSAYEYDDPRPGYDLVMQGETGWISMNGTDQDHLAKLPVAIIDIVAAHQMKEGILLAMLKKQYTGAGSVVHVSLFKSAISALANQASNYLMENHIPKPLGTLHPNIAPYGDMFVTKDSYKILLAVGSDAQFKKLWFSLNLDEILYHTFELNSDRLRTRQRLSELLQQAVGVYDFKEIEMKLKMIHIPFCLIKNMQDVFEDPLAKTMVNTMEIDGANCSSVSNIAFHFS